MGNASTAQARTRWTGVASTIAALMASIIAAGAMAGASPGVAQESPGQPGIAVPEEGGIAILNYYRDLAGVDPVTENLTWSAEGTKHANYIVRTGQSGHTEDSNSPHYTADGARAGALGNVAASPGDASDRVLVEAWASGPFHALAMLDPRLSESGYASLRDESSTSGIKTAAVLDVSRGNSQAEWSEAVSEPILYPAPGKVSPLTLIAAFEKPSPLVSCGYTTPAGAPAYAMMPETEGPYSYEMKDEAGNVLEACAYDATEYTNPDSQAQRTARYHLDSRNAIVIIPKQPLDSNQTYSVAVTTCSREVEWSYGVAYLPETYTPGAGVDVSAPRPAACDDDPPLDPDPEEPTVPEPPVEKPNLKPFVSGRSMLATKAKRPVVVALVRDRDGDLARKDITVKLDGRVISRGVSYNAKTDRLTIRSPRTLRPGIHRVFVAVRDADNAAASKTVLVKILKTGRR